jgi:hypothetical protein
MTPEEIQQARAMATGIERNTRRCCATEGFLARATLALTEERTDANAGFRADVLGILRQTDMTGSRDDVADKIVTALALTEQQPETDLCRTLTKMLTQARVESGDLPEQQPAPTCTCEYPYPVGVWDGHHPNCASEQQPEPVSRSELFALIAKGTSGEWQNYITDQLLSRYTVTRKAGA